jgi:hypothetical protein
LLFFICVYRIWWSSNDRYGHNCLYWGVKLMLKSNQMCSQCSRAGGVKLMLKANQMCSHGNRTDICCLVVSHFCNSATFLTIYTWWNFYDRTIIVYHHLSITEDCTYNSSYILNENSLKLCMLANYHMKFDRTISFVGVISLFHFNIS